MIQHSVFDGISLEFFLQDFDALLAAGNNIFFFPPPTTSPLPRIDRIRIPLPQLSSSANFRAMAYQSPSRHSFPSTQRYFLDKKLPEWLKGDSTGWIDKSTGKPLFLLASSEEEKEEVNNVTRLSPKNLSPRYTTPQTHPRHRRLHRHESCSRFTQYQTHGAQSRAVCRIFCREKFLATPSGVDVEGFAVADGGRWADGAEGCCGD